MFQTIRWLSRHAAVLFVALLLPGAALGDPIYQGTVTLRDGTVYHALDIRGLGEITNRSETIQLRFADRTNTEIHKSRIRAFDFAQIDGHNVAIEATVTLTNGNSAALRSVRLGQQIELYVEDDFTGEARWIDFNLRRGEQTIARIELHSMGGSMWSDDSQRAFPSDYYFDPYTGVRLIAR